MIYGIIPARLESTRLPRKMLLAETGKPLIQHTWEAAKRCHALDDVIVATDSADIAWAVEQFGGRVEMTGKHASGTDRCAEVVKRLPDAEIIVNIQGDEPEIDPQDIDATVALLQATPDADIAALARAPEPGEISDPNCVKVVISTATSQALYFTRSALSVGFIHCGIYAFRVDALRLFCGLMPSYLERKERLEQLRALEHGMRIVVGRAIGQFHGIDTPEDYRRFVERVRHGIH